MQKLGCSLDFAEFWTAWKWWDVHSGDVDLVVKDLSHFLPKHSMHIEVLARRAARNLCLLTLLRKGSEWMTNLTSTLNEAWINSSLGGRIITG
jgi:hypothetical protein